MTPLSSRLNISITVPDRRLVTIDHLWETPHGESNKCARSTLDWSQSKIFLVYFAFPFDSFVTPPLHVEADRPPRSAQHSLDFTRSRGLNSDPVPVTPDPRRLSNHSCPDTSSCLERPASQLQSPRCSNKTSEHEDNPALPSRQSVGSTTVKVCCVSNLFSFAEHVIDLQNSLPADRIDFGSFPKFRCSTS